MALRTVQRSPTPTGSEMSLIQEFMRDAFDVFPRMHIAAREVRGVDGVADIVLTRTTSLERYASQLVYYYGAACIATCSFHLSPTHFRPSVKLFSDIVAIEAKVSDWTRALYQATRYRQFAHRTYVLLDESGLSKAKRRRDVFENAGVGLIGKSESGFRTIVSSPRLRPFARLDYSFFASRVVEPHLINPELVLKPFSPTTQVGECPSWRDYIRGITFRLQQHTV